MPRFAVLRNDGASPMAEKNCQVASSNLPTYHITFMWPM